jgi:hypothetical protein
VNSLWSKGASSFPSTCTLRGRSTLKIHESTHLVKAEPRRIASTRAGLLVFREIALRSDDNATLAVRESVPGDSRS